MKNFSTFTETSGEKNRMKDLSVLKPPFDEQKKRFLKLKENLQNDMKGGTVDTDYPTASGYNAQGNFPPAFIK